MFTSRVHRRLLRSCSATRRSLASLEALESMYDTVIVGGGAVGASIAYHLIVKDPTHKIAVIERDSSYAKASCMLSAGGIRQQFTRRENVLMSIYGVNFLKNSQDILRLDANDEEVPDVQFHEHGYLMLVNSDSGEKVIRESNALQHDCGADWLKIVDAQEMNERFPWLDTNMARLGCYGTENEGYFDPWAYVNALRRKAKSCGVEFIEASVTGADIGMDASGSHMVMKGLHTDGGPETVRGRQFVNAAGAWSSGLLESMSAKSPKPLHPLGVEARKRCMFMFKCAGVTAPPAATPLTVFPDGVYFRPEGGGGNFITGVSPAEDQDPHHMCDTALDFIDHELFEDVLWPSLATHVPAFEAVKVSSAWAGFYEYNVLDQNAVIGPHPDVPNLVMCTGFSGHGLQMSPAAGLVMSEILVDGKTSTIDVSNFSFDRLLVNEAYAELAVI